MSDELQKNQIVELEVADIGGAGDGIAKYDGQVVFVPFTCKGDLVKTQIDSVGSDFCRASLVEVIKPSLERQASACEHFGVCGGCSLQHLSSLSYQVFKRGIITDIVKRLELDEGIVSDVIEGWMRARRRAELKVAVNKGEVSLGFYAPKSHDVVNITSCAVMDERIVRLIPDLRVCLGNLKKSGNISAINITALDDGLDIIFIAKGLVKDKDKKKLIVFASENSVIIRLSVQLEESKKSIEILYKNGNPSTVFAGIPVELPVAAFLQATAKGQDELTKFIIANTKGADRVADLFSGCGTYSFPLLENAAHVSAYEGDKDMVTAMFNAARRAGVENRVSAQVRDLFLNPLSAEELSRYDAVVINPPRAGAKTQSEQISKSDVKKIVMVSCNPNTFERDAKSLIGGGYRLTQIVPVDQFYWSSHLELVAAFERE
ncbi:MAG: 23S rRNA (uracil(1939)-C(5))-methyltransferase RlmD [Alphaproteobacteria bacterium]|nr:23S rRNA (uracil(1939)-C(5))-methyltransferase RlmD [Alphaproteobacteria bacterium]